MSKSHSPLALSVVAVTQPGDAASTAAEILTFDDRKFGFSHEKTWAAMPAALRGVLDPDRVMESLGAMPARVASAIASLCRIGIERPVTTHRLRDHPGAGLKEVEGLRVGPAVTIRAKATCWYVRAETPVLPILQPRKAHLGEFKLGMYAGMVRRAYCKGPWRRAITEVIDLSGDDGSRRVLTEEDLSLPTDDELNEFIGTYVEAQAIAAAVRAKRGPTRHEPAALPLYDSDPRLPKG